MSYRETPLILAFVSDLYFTSRIESVSQKLDFEVQIIERADEIGLEIPDSAPSSLVESPERQGAALLEQLTLWHPALIVFDLNNQAIPWPDWIALIKLSPATRRIPVLCFGAHMDVKAMDLAKSTGADVVVARSRFVGALGELIQKYARRIDFHALGEACHMPLSEIAVRGLEEFNLGEYFEAHETLEAAWNADDTPGKELYRAILQVAVAYLQIERGNYRGAMKMFLRLRQWIDPLPEFCRGVNVEQLRADAWQVQEALTKLGAEHIGEFDRGLFKPVLYVR